MRVLVCGGREYGYEWRNGKQCYNAAQVKALDGTLGEVFGFWKERRFLSETNSKTLYSVDEYVDHTFGLAPTTPTVIHGAAKGADRLAGEWAAYQGINVIEVPAEWDKYGKRAGFLRNQKMLTYEPDLVVAFPGGAGTKMMIDLARGKGVPVLEI